jgi:sodium-dependent dicarboxylate transporter 2/3/5
LSENIRPGGTYKTLDEQREVLSPAEERFERRRRTIGLFLGPLALLVMMILPLGLPYTQQSLAAVLAFVVVYWVTEAIPIPVTAVIGLALTAVIGVVLITFGITVMARLVGLA